MSAKISALLAARAGELLVLLGGLLWGFSGACAEFLFSRQAISPHLLVPWRLLLAGALCLALHRARSGRWGAQMLSNPRDFARLLAFSAGGIALCQYTYFWGISLSNTAIATVIQYTAPGLIIAYACCAERRWPRGYELAAMAAISAGVLLLASGGDFSQLAISPFALFICALSALGSAVYTLLPARINARYGALAVLGWAMLLAGGALILLRALKPPVLALADAAAFAAIVLLGTVAAFSLFMLGLARVGAARAALIASTEPLAAAAIAWLWLGSALNAVQLCGFALVMAGVLISFRKKDV